jgi:hypothetical protein
VQFSRVDTSINGRSLTTIGTQSDFGRSVGDSSFGLGV